MSGDLKPTSAEEFTRLTTKIVTTKSGITYRIKMMGAASTVKYMSIIPSEGIQGDSTRFLIDHAKELIDDVVLPNILEPKLTNETLPFSDFVELMSEVAKISGMSAEDADKESTFRQ